MFTVQQLVIEASVAWVNIYLIVLVGCSSPSVSPLSTHVDLSSLPPSLPLSLFFSIHYFPIPSIPHSPALPCSQFLSILYLYRPSSPSPSLYPTFLFLPCYQYLSIKYPTQAHTHAFSPPLLTPLSHSPSLSLPLSASLLSLYLSPSLSLTLSPPLSLSPSLSFSLSLCLSPSFFYFFIFYNRPIWQSVRMCVVGGGAGAVRRGSIDNLYLSTGLSWSPGWPWRGWSWFRCELGSWDELWSIFQLIAVNV